MRSLEHCNLVVEETRRGPKHVGADCEIRKNKDDRRSADRFPIAREVRFKLLNRKSANEVCSVKTINMSGNSVLFTTHPYLLPGRRLEISISWADQQVNLKLVARDRVVRCDEGRAAIEIHQYEFRAQSTPGPQPLN